MNKYKKYCPNVFVAECEQEHKKWDVITVETKYWKENEHIVHNLVAQKWELYYYSITRVDWYDNKERAKRKIEKLEWYSRNAINRSGNYYNASNEWREFLSLAEPIKIWHHSESKHRALIERNSRRMEKSVKEKDKAGEYQEKAKYWGELKDIIDLSMPESINYFKDKLERAKERHAKIKSGELPKEHSYSLTYAKKTSNDIQKKYDTAIKLWW